MIKHSYATTGLVTDVYLVALLDQFLHGTSHADDVVIGVGREYEHFLTSVLAGSIRDGVHETLSHLAIESFHLEVELFYELV